MTMRVLTVAPLIAASLVASCSQAQVASGPGMADASPQPASTPGVVRAETVARGLENPWGLDFLPDGRMLVTERPGRLRIVAADGSLSLPLDGVPAVYARGQGGLLDVAVDPDFASNRFIYLTYAEPGPGGAGTSAARARLDGTRLVDLQVIYRQRPKTEGGGHYGSRLVFASDGKLFISQGDRMLHREKAQDLSAGMGKLIRINRDGTIPNDNPFVGRSDAQPEIWSYGHRNMQGATLAPDGRLWTIEHGARGGDELNHPEPGKNYGWPVITYGRDYSGLKIGEGVAKEGMEQPVYYWDPVIAPSGMTFYAGDRYAGWTGDLFIGSLSPGGLVRLTLREGRVTREMRYLGELRERIRDVVQGPDGFLYLLTDSRDGRVLRILPETP
ncbi:MAG: PQQ-dependent sugar dehydrogenase [Gemmatimonadaceae bacterium]|nr:PQQ-dependent sugar dehydrogenase [Gemmatimonadaceae bacterium]